MSYISVEKLTDTLEFNRQEQGCNSIEISAVIKYIKSHGVDIVGKIRNIYDQCDDEATCEQLDDLIMALEDED